MVWALHELGSTGWEDAALCRSSNAVARDPSPWDEDPVETSYSFGELGVALVAFRLTGDAGLADRIHELVLAVRASETNEVMAGAPGSLLVAEAMLAWTGEPRWDEAWRTVAERVSAARDADGLWTQHIVGPPARYLGPAHGYAGNMRALANRGDARRARRSARRTSCARTVSRTGCRVRMRDRTRSACSGATARLGWSRRSATCSTSSLRSPAAS